MTDFCLLNCPSLSFVATSWGKQVLGRKERISKHDCILSIEHDCDNAQGLWCHRKSIVSYFPPYCFLPL